MAPEHIRGLSLLGGEPFEPANQGPVLELVERVRKELPHKTIWCYSGFLFEELAAGRVGDHSRALLEGLDVLVDGPFVMENGNVRARTNHAGGVLGGITSGMPLVVNIAVKPTASISREQETVDLETKENAPLVIHGRHDPCIVPRAVPVAEAVTALTVLDMMLE